MTGLLSDAYAKTASICTIMNGFKITGIWPVDRSVFSETDFIAAMPCLKMVQKKQVRAQRQKVYVKRLLSLKTILLSHQFTVMVLNNTKIATQQISIPLLKKFTLYLE
ncbi:unnamed protein product [Acanthoscelides obtectus]|uniref:Uncharacterized protein n=1 Tax=Acanthoscelides obtectus TaxID=200917 RepID=A0A9P0PJY5_ACAOB|nr:unnamed protein product [Acanthoscelides obtectus]CAK1681091.1 hypothetical protein AOBTE_LOCUS33013 [Acanthoscelides obtectus]